MVRKSMLILAIALATIGLASPVFADDISASYLIGKWALDSAKDCSSDDSVYIIFNKAGSFEFGRSGRAESTGFWSVQGEVLTVEMLTSPAYFDDLDTGLKAYEDQYHHYTVVSMLVDQKKDSFTSVASLRDQITKYSAYRCK